MTAALVCAVLALSIVGSGAPPAHAQQVASVHFSCTMNLAVWPSSNGGSATCVGDATGFGVLGGQQIACVLPRCTFVAAIHNYTEPCPVPDLPAAPPMVGFYEGDIFIAGVFMGTFNWVRVGTKLYFVPPGTTRGHAVWLPHPPLGTCEAPFPLTVDVHGQIAVV